MGPSPPQKRGSIAACKILDSRFRGNDENPPSTSNCRLLTVDCRLFFWTELPDPL